MYEHHIKISSWTKSDSKIFIHTEYIHSIFSKLFSFHFSLFTLEIDICYILFILFVRTMYVLFFLITQHKSYLIKIYFIIGLKVELIMLELSKLNLLFQLSVI